MICVVVWKSRECSCQLVGGSSIITSFNRAQVNILSATKPALPAFAMSLCCIVLLSSLN